MRRGFALYIRHCAYIGANFSGENHPLAKRLPVSSTKGGRRTQPIAHPLRTGLGVPHGDGHRQRHPRHPDQCVLSSSCPARSGVRTGGTARSLYLLLPHRPQVAAHPERPARLATDRPVMPPGAARPRSIAPSRPFRQMMQKMIPGMPKPEGMPSDDRQHLQRNTHSGQNRALMQDMVPHCMTMMFSEMDAGEHRSLAKSSL